MKIKGVYDIKSKATGKIVYTGASFDINWDWFIHLETLKKGEHPDKDLQAYFSEYGPDDYDKIIIEQFNVISRASLFEKAEKRRKEIAKKLVKEELLVVEAEEPEVEVKEPEVQKKRRRRKKDESG